MRFYVGVVISWISGRMKLQETKTFSALSLAKANAKGYVYRLQRTTKTAKESKYAQRNPLVRVHPQCSRPLLSVITVCFTHCLINSSKVG